MTRLDFQSLRQHKKRVLTRPTVSGTAAPEVGKKKYDWLRGRRSSLTDPGSVFAHAASGRHMNELTGVLGHFLSRLTALKRPPASHLHV